MSSPAISGGTSLFTGFTRLCKGLAIVLVGGHIILQILPSSVDYLALIPARAALIRAMVSKEAIVFRRQLCRVIADIIYQWTSEAFGQATTIAQYGTRVSLASGPGNQESPRLATPINDYHYIFRDRWLRVIFSKVLGSTRKDPVLLVRFFWVSFVMLVSASALAFHRMLVTLSGGYLSPAAPFASKRSYAYTR